MLTITVLGKEFWDEDLGEFLYPDSFELHLEHSLVALSKWESKFEKPFLGPGAKTQEESLGYIYCMILTPGITPHITSLLSDEDILEVDRYINAKMTATWFNETKPEPKSSEIITSELIYYWMASFNIPIEVEKWHLNRLFTLIKVHGAKNSQPKKMSASEARARQRELNAQRRRQLGTSG